MQKYFGGLLGFYILIRALSFFLVGFVALQNIIAAALVATFIFFCVKDLSTAWKLLIVELLLDGAGHFFELHGLLLRTWLLGIFAIFWLARRRTKIVLPPKNTWIALGVFAACFAWAIINGILHHNGITPVLQDAMLYLFAALMFPGLEMESGRQRIYGAAVKVFIVGSAIFSVLTLALYSSGYYILQNSYYHWFRDVAAGKITDLGTHFFRIVTAEQILFVPIILILLGMLTKKITDKKIWTLMTLSLTVLILNFTRIYFIGIAVGAGFLLFYTPWKQWLRACGLTLLASAIIFFGFHLAASRGQSLGLELLGVRASGIRAPTTDPSGAIRLALLPDIKRHILAHPLLGSGLATQVTYLDPLTKTYLMRTQFDWGYLQMITDLGMTGTAAYIFFLGTLLYNFEKKIKMPGYIAGAIALFVINFTTPAIFQGFGVLYFALLVVATQHPSLLTDPV